MIQVPNFISQIPDQLNDAFIQVIVKGAEITKSITDYFETKRNDFIQTDFWQQQGKPFYERNIEPLDTTDYLLLGGSLCSAVLITAVTVSIFTVAAFPLALGGGTLLFAGACTYSRYRVRKHFDNLAWDHIDEIRRLSYKTSSKQQYFGNISEERARLMQPEFSHLDIQIKELDEELRKFRNVVLSADCNDKKNVVKAHLTYLVNLVQTSAHDKALIEALESEIDKVGQKNQNLTALETNKQKLHDLQTTQARTHIAELKQQIDTFVKATEGPSLTDSREVFRKFAEGLQEKLASHRTIEDLSLDDDENDNDIKKDEDKSKEDKSPIDDQSKGDVQIRVDEENKDDMKIFVDEEVDEEDVQIRVDEIDE